MKDYDKMVEDWHNGAGEGMELHEYLGLTWEEYASQCVPIPKTLLDEMQRIREMADANRKREAATQLNNAFNIIFNRYEGAFKELADK